jgi:hypothetical protein
MVQPAGFELAAYGFEGMTSEFPDLLKLNQPTEIIKLNNFTFLLIFHILANVGKLF